MLKEMQNTGIELSFSDIENLEKDNNFSLPSDYKEFLLKYNGGTPVECGCDFDEPKNGTEGEDISYFFGLERKDNIPNFLNALALSIPKGIVPIADTAGGHFFLLSTNKNTFGTVYFKDQEVEDSFDLNDSNNELPESIIIAANSFTEFIEKLYDPDE